VECPVYDKMIAFREVGAHAKSAHPVSAVRGRKPRKASEARRARQATAESFQQPRIGEGADYVFKLCGILRMYTPLTSAFAMSG